MSWTTTGHPRQPRIAQCLFVLLVSLVSVLAGCGGDDGDKPRNPVPVLTSVSPASATVGGAATTLTATGSGFVAGSAVHWNGTARSTTFVSGTRLTVAIPAGDLAAAGTAQVTVVNPPPGGGTSSAVAFAIQNAVPVVASLNPASITAGSAAFDLTVSGSGFVTGATVQWNGVARPTTFVSSSVLTAAIGAADVATDGAAQVRVVNPAPGGGASAELTFTIEPGGPVVPVLEITSLDPSGVEAGSPAFDLAVTGTGFVQGATVLWNGASRTTTFLSATQVTAAIPAADVATPGYVDIAVQNPGPDGATSNVLEFVISNVPPPAGVPVRVTVAPDGTLPNGPSINGGMDWEGRYVVFASKASNLVPGDTNDAWDIFVRDTCGYTAEPCTPTTVRISVAPDGSQANGNSGATATSPDNALAVSFTGRYVAYVSSASNLVEDDTNGVDDVFLSDTCIEALPDCVPYTVRVSVRADGSQTVSPSSAPAIGEDNGQVAFVSAEAGLVAGDGNGVADVFVRDVCLYEPDDCTPSTQRVSVATGGGDANGSSGSPAFTGRYVAFVSVATNLVGNDTNGLADVFMRDTCIAVPDECTPSTERISIGAGGVQADGTSSDPRVGPQMSDMDGYDYHGRFIAFVSSAANLVAGDTNGVADVFMRDTCRGRPDCIPSTQRISVTDAGQQIVGQPSLAPGFLSWDGEVIPFVTAANGVVPEDTNGFADVYVRHVCNGRPDCEETTTRVSVGEGGVQGNQASAAPRLNHEPFSPGVVTFVSQATNLLPDAVPTPYFGSIFKTTWP